VRLERAIKSEPLLQPGPQNLQRIRVELAHPHTFKRTSQCDAAYQDPDVDLERNKHHQKQERWDVVTNMVAVITAVSLVAVTAQVT
jgi:hypothetical protein